MDDSSMTVIYEYWPPPVRGTQDDPITGTTVATSLRHACKIAADLRSKYGEDLRFVDVRIRILET